MSDAVDLIHATVRLEQALPRGSSTVGTGFVVMAAAPDGTPRVVLVTADHVLARMPGDKVKVGFRAIDETGGWRYAPLGVRIRDAEGDPLWTRHPVQDVAAIELPLGASQAAAPAASLVGDGTLKSLHLEPGDEMMVLGYPHGYSANASGFPILRSGRVASYPLSPATRYPTFLLDFSVFAGNSGGPVYIVRSVTTRSGVERRLIITGILTQQLKLKSDRLEIGNVTQAAYIAETLSLLEGASPAEVTPTKGDLPRADPMPASGGPEPTALQRLREAWDAVTADVEVLLRRAWIVVREAVLDRITPDPRRVGLGSGRPQPRVTGPHRGPVYDTDTRR